MAPSATAIEANDPSEPHELQPGQPVNVTVVKDANIYLKIMRPLPGLVLRVAWDFAAHPPLTLFGFGAVPYYSGAGGQYREWHLWSSNYTGSNIWLPDLHSRRDVYHCASFACATYCGAADVEANRPCLSAQPPAPQSPEENTGFLYATVSGHFTGPGEMVSGSILCDWLDTDSPAPLSSPSSPAPQEPDLLDDLHTVPSSPPSLPDGRVLGLTQLGTPPEATIIIVISSVVLLIFGLLSCRIAVRSTRVRNQTGGRVAWRKPSSQKSSTLEPEESSTGASIVMHDLLGNPVHDPVASASIPSAGTAPESDIGQSRATSEHACVGAGTPPEIMRC